MMYLEDRPYEKCEQYGAEHLTDVELLAVLLRTGTKGENSLRLAQKILHPVALFRARARPHEEAHADLLPHGTGRNVR